MYLQTANQTTLIAAAATVSAGFLGSLIGGLVNSAKFHATIETKVDERFAAKDHELDSIRTDQRDQWTKINSNEKETGLLGQRVSKIEGRMNGHSHAAHAGGD